jgi:hypothetical protein
MHDQRQETLKHCRQSLAGCCDAAGVRSAVGELCAQYGKVVRLDVLTMARAQKRQALCFMRLESPAQEQDLIAGLGAARFGDDLLVIVDLDMSRPERSTAQTAPRNVL